MKSHDACWREGGEEFDLLFNAKMELLDNKSSIGSHKSDSEVNFRICIKCQDISKSCYLCSIFKNLFQIIPLSKSLLMEKNTGLKNYLPKVFKTLP